MIVFNVYRYVEIIPISFVDGPVCTAVDISIPIGAMNEERKKVPTLAATAAGK